MTTTETPIALAKKVQREHAGSPPRCPTCILADALLEAVGHIRDLVDVVQWMSGSSDFAPEGQAGSGWINDARPKLFAAMEALRALGDGQEARDE